MDEIELVEKEGISKQGKIVIGVTIFLALAVVILSIGKKKPVIKELPKKVAKKQPIQITINNTSEKPVVNPVVISEEELEEELEEEEEEEV